MSKKARAVLRDIDGRHIKNLDADEIEVYEFWADQKRVNRSVAMKKGRATVIFRLKENCLPEAEPSASLESPCSLTLWDIERLSEFGTEGARTPRALIERWIGHGLIPLRVEVRSL